MKKLLLSAVSVLFGLGTFAQGPNNSGTYYQNANGKKGSALKTALYKIISPHTEIGYTNALLEAYKKTDTRPDGYVRDWYSKTTSFTHIKDKAGNYSKEGDVYNREHLVPQSWFGSGEPKSDLMQVVPTDGYVNNRRSNYPLGEVGSATYTSNGGYCKLGTCKTEGYTGTVFEPGDDVKGDIARIYFYMVTCYENLVSGWDGATASLVFSGDTYPAFNEWYLNMLMRWSREDPIDDVEIARNIAVYGKDAAGKYLYEDNKMQGNRNPFVDYPGLEEYIWGAKKNVAFSYDNYDGTSVTPVDPQPGEDDTQTEQTLLNETLLSSTLPATFTVTGTTGIWKGDAKYGAKASAYINNTCTESDTWLLTPVIDLADYASATMNFDHAGNKFNGAAMTSYCSVGIREEGSSEWTWLNITAWPEGTNWTFVSTGDIDLSAFAGKKIQIGFHYTSTTSVAGTWEVQKLKVTGMKTATTIEYIVRPVEVEERVFNLDGRLVPPSQRWTGGRRIYIKNGKKIIIN